MQARNPHAAIVKSLIGFWVLGMRAPSVAQLITQTVWRAIELRGSSEGTGGAFDAMRQGFGRTLESGSLQETAPILGIVAVVAAVFFLRSPIPRVVRQALGRIPA